MKIRAVVIQTKEPEDAYVLWLYPVNDFENSEEDGMEVRIFYNGRWQNLFQGTLNYILKNVDKVLEIVNQKIEDTNIRIDNLLDSENTESLIYQINELNTKIENLPSVLVFKGTVQTVSDLQSITEKSNGDVYFVGTSDTHYEEYVWSSASSSWINVGILNDLTNYYTKDEVYSKEAVDTKLLAYLKSSDLSDQIYNWCTANNVLFEGSVYSKTEIDNKYTTLNNLITANTETCEDLQEQIDAIDLNIPINDLTINAVQGGSKYFNFPVIEAGKTSLEKLYTFTGADNLSASGRDTQSYFRATYSIYNATFEFGDGQMGSTIKLHAQKYRNIGNSIYISPKLYSSSEEIAKVENSANLYFPGYTGDIVVSKLSSSLTHGHIYPICMYETMEGLLTATSNTDSTPLIGMSIGAGNPYFQIGNYSHPGYLKIFNANNYTTIKSNSASETSTTITLPKKTGTLATTEDVKACPTNSIIMYPVSIGEYGGTFESMTSVGTNRLSVTIPEGYSVVTNSSLVYMEKKLNYDACRAVGAGTSMQCIVYIKKN